MALGNSKSDRRANRRQAKRTLQNAGRLEGDSRRGIFGRDLQAFFQLQSAIARGESLETATNKSAAGILKNALNRRARGNCPSPSKLDSRGGKCGGRSTESKPGNNRIAQI